MQKHDRPPVRDLRHPFIAMATSKARTSAVKKDCAVKGCPIQTREGKDYCSDHVERCDYVKSILDARKQHLLETRRINKNPGALTIDTEIVRDAINFLTYDGPLSLEKLASLLSASNTLVEKIVMLLARQRMVTVKKTKRGSRLIVPLRVAS